MADLGMKADALCDWLEGISEVTGAGNALAFLNSGYRRFVSGEDPREGMPAHLWSFIQTTDAIAIGTPVTDTCTATDNGDGTANVVSDATAAKFNRSMVGLTMTITGATIDSAVITAFVDADNVTVDDDTTWANKAISIQGNGIIDLPANFGGLLDDVLYPSTPTLVKPRVKKADPKAILSLWRDYPTLVETPEYFAIIPKTFTTATGQRWQLLLAHRPTAARTWLYRYRLLADVLTDAAVYALGGPDHVETLKYLMAAAWETDKHDGAGNFSRLADRLMVKSIDLDKRFIRSRGPVSIANVDVGM